MEQLGEKIASLRKQHGLTQAQLGEKLNVTSQAVSKWEKGLSEPDFQTAQKICDLFGITADDLMGRPAPTKPVETEEAVTQTTAAQTAVESKPPKIINGYCERCKKPVGPGEYTLRSAARGTVQHIYCNECAEIVAKDERRTTCASALRDHNKMMRRSLIWGSIAGAAILALFLAASLTNLQEIETTVGGAIGISIFCGYAVFAFVTQMIWGESVLSLFMFFLRSFTMPGVIFTLDLDGLIFLLLVKIGGAILSVLLSVIVFLLGLIITPLYAAIIFPFALLKRLHEGKNYKNDYDSVA